MNVRRTALIETRPMQIALMVVVIVGLPAMIGLAVANRRDSLIGALCGLIFFSVFALGASPAARGWSKLHPLTDGAILGPLTFVLACLIRPIPVWVCVLVGASATGGGVVRGVQRRARWASSAQEPEHQSDQAEDIQPAP